MITRFQVSISADLFRKLFLVSEKREGSPLVRSCFCACFERLREVILSVLDNPIDCPVNIKKKTFKTMLVVFFFILLSQICEKESAI